MDKIRKRVFREKLGVALISTKMRENRLRWFVMCRERVLTPSLGGFYYLKNRIFGSRTIWYPILNTRN